MEHAAGGESFMAKKMRVQVALMQRWRPEAPRSDCARAWVDEGMAERFGELVDANPAALDGNDYDKFLKDIESFKVHPEKEAA